MHNFFDIWLCFFHFQRVLYGSNMLVSPSAENHVHVNEVLTIVTYWLQGFIK